MMQWSAAPRLTSEVDYAALETNDPLGASVYLANIELTSPESAEFRT
jgi:hypothetical protein